MYTCCTLLLDFCFMSGALFIAKLLRSKIKWLQNHYIPASVIAGLIGLLLGPQVAKIIPWSSEASSYPHLLICVLFATLFIGRKEKVKVKQVFKSVGDTFFMNTGAEIFTFGIAILVGGAIMLVFFPNMFPEMSLLLPAGFTGGHGYAAAIGGSLNNLLGRDDAISIGQVFATVGLLTGLLVGIVCINIAAKKGATRFVKKASALPKEYRTGLVSEENAVSMGRVTTYATSMESSSKCSLSRLFRSSWLRLDAFGRASFLQPLDCCCLERVRSFTVYKRKSGLNFVKVKRKSLTRNGGIL